MSGEVFGGPEAKVFDHDVIQSIAEDVVEVQQLGVNIAIVVGGGNIYRGAKSAPFTVNRVVGDHMGMLATVINSLCLQEAIERLGVPTRVMSAIEMPSICETYIQRKANRHLEKQRIVLFAAGTGNPFFTTDTAAVLRASEIGANVVIKATKTDGVYDKDPMLHADAVKFESLTYAEVLERNLKVMDATAIAFCKDNNLPIVVLDMGAKQAILNTIRGQQVGTLIQ